MTLTRAQKAYCPTKKKTVRRAAHKLKRAAASKSKFVRSSANPAKAKSTSTTKKTTFVRAVVKPRAAKPRATHTRTSNWTRSSYKHLVCQPQKTVKTSKHIKVTKLKKAVLRTKVR